MLSLVLTLLRFQLRVTGWDLLSTLREQAAYQDYYDSAQPVACPRDGEPLTLAPPDAECQLFCKFCGFSYPDDWDARTMSGM